MKTNNVYVGNNIEVLKTFPDNYFDSVVVGNIHENKDLLDEKVL